MTGISKILISLELKNIIQEEKLSNGFGDVSSSTISPPTISPPTISPPTITPPCHLIA
jgi:hypothetical protein